MIDIEQMRVRLKGNGVTKTFQFPFKLNKPDDLKVSTFDGTSLTEQTNFSITPADGGYPTNGGTVTYPESGVAVGTDITVIIERSMRLVQNDSYERNDTFSVENLEKTFDTIVQEVQQVNDGTERSIKFPSNFGTDIDTTLPADIKPGQSFQLSDDGKKFVASNYPEQAAGSAGEAAMSEANAKNSEIMAEKWAQSTVSPDNSADSDSPTGLTQSSRTWALTAKEWVDGANNSINNYREQAVNEITKLHSDAVHNINGTYDGITEDLNERHMNAVQDITNAHSTAMTDIAGGESDALNAITTAGDAYKADLQALADKAEDSADAAEESKADAESAAEEARAAANTAGSASAPAWDAETTYNYPDVVAYIDGYAYRCIGQNVVGEAPGSSDKWVIQTLKSFFDTDGKGDVMPAVIAAYDDEWELDEQDDMMPKQ